MSHPWQAKVSSDRDGGERGGRRDRGDRNDRGHLAALFSLNLNPFDFEPPAACPRNGCQSNECHHACGHPR